MTASYQHLALSQVTPGMVLSDELLDVQGQVLLPQGTVLTEAILALMPRHGIGMLSVVHSGISEEQLEASREHHRQRLDRLFRHNDRDADGDWATTLLRSYVEEFRLGHGEAP